MRSKNIYKQSNSGPLWPVALACRIGIMVLLLSCCRLVAMAQSSGPDEYRLKLAYLYNFAQFVQWPPEAFHDSASPLVLCVDGANPFKGDIENELNGRKVGGHPVSLKQLRPDDDPNACHVVFVRAGQKKLEARLISVVKGSTLTVGESRGFAESGGLINLTLEENKLRFEINLEAATQSKLKVSSKLLTLAKIVK